VTEKRSPRRSRVSPANEERRRVRPRKQFGQHFLTDTNLLQKIVRVAEIQPDDVILEIGPGLGHLTRALLQAGARVVAIEIDRELAERLRSEAEGNPALIVLQGDFLTASPGQWLDRAGLAGARYKVVANLPYYITSAILRHLLETEHQPDLIVVMVQREVAQQITAKPNDMNLLGVSVQFYGEPQFVTVVPAGAFYPRPKVDSALVRIRVEHPSCFPQVDAGRFFQIVRAGFSERRKQLRNALAHGLNMDADEVAARLARAGLDPRRRAETLSMEEWQRLRSQFL
jgi:16S rRNA (adenine1518-N6/adenine1519-N6)-dimethyltransferase